jgi:hypothetical protein
MGPMGLKGKTRFSTATERGNGSLQMSYLAPLRKNAISSTDSRTDVYYQKGTGEVLYRLKKRTATTYLITGVLADGIQTGTLVSVTGDTTHIEIFSEQTLKLVSRLALASAEPTTKDLLVPAQVIGNAAPITASGHYTFEPLVDSDVVLNTVKIEAVGASGWSPSGNKNKGYGGKVIAFVNRLPAELNVLLGTTRQAGVTNGGGGATVISDETLLKRCIVIAGGGGSGYLGGATNVFYPGGAGGGGSGGIDLLSGNGEGDATSGVGTGPGTLGSIPGGPGSNGIGGTGKESTDVSLFFSDATLFQGSLNDDGGGGGGGWGSGGTGTKAGGGGGGSYAPPVDEGGASSGYSTNQPAVYATSAPTDLGTDLGASRVTFTYLPPVEKVQREENRLYVKQPGMGAAAAAAVGPVTYGVVFQGGTIVVTGTTAVGLKTTTTLRNELPGLTQVVITADEGTVQTYALTIQNRVPISTGGLTMPLELPEGVEKLQVALTGAPGGGGPTGGLPGVVTAGLAAPPGVVHLTTGGTGYGYKGPYAGGGGSVLLDNASRLLLLAGGGGGGGADNPLYIADYDNNRLLRFCPPGLTGRDWTDREVVTGLKGPRQVALDEATNDIYVVNQSGSDLVKITPNGTKIPFGTPGTGRKQFNNPNGLALQGDFIYIADTGNNRVVSFNKGFQGWQSYPFTETPVTRQLKAPWGVCVVGDQMWVTDAGNNRVVQMPATLNVTAGNTWTALGNKGTGRFEFQSPHGITATAAGRLYIADTGNHRIICMDNINGDNWFTFGTQGSGRNNFNFPENIFVDRDYIYIADRGNHRIVRITALDGSDWTTFGSIGNGRLPIQFNNPSAVARNRLLARGGPGGGGGGAGRNLNGTAAGAGGNAGEGGGVGIASGADVTLPITEATGLALPGLRYPKNSTPPVALAGGGGGNGTLGGAGGGGYGGGGAGTTEGGGGAGGSYAAPDTLAATYATGGPGAAAQATFVYLPPLQIRNITTESGILNLSQSEISSREGWVLNYTLTEPTSAEAPYRITATAQVSATAPIVLQTVTLLDLPPGIATLVISNEVTNEVAPPLHVQSSPVCFLKGTRILTVAGYQPVESLTLATGLVTKKGVAVPMQRLLHFTATAETCPLYCLPQDVLEPDVPVRPLYMSANHAFRYEGKWRHMKCTPAASPVPAAAAPWVYYHIVLDDYFAHTIFAEGVEVETCFDRAQHLPAAEHLCWSCTATECLPLKCTLLDN